MQWFDFAPAVKEQPVFGAEPDAKWVARLAVERASPFAMRAPQVLRFSRPVVVGAVLIAQCYIAESEKVWHESHCCQSIPAEPVEQLELTHTLVAAPGMIITVKLAESVNVSASFGELGRAEPSTASASHGA